MKDSLETNDIYNKVSKVVTATHLVADIISKSEPIGVSMKSESLKLLNGNLYLKNRATEEHIRHFVSSVDVCVSLIKIATLTHLISDMNARWLLKGYTVIKDMYENQSVQSLSLEAYDIKDIEAIEFKDKSNLYSDKVEAVSKSLKTTSTSAFTRENSRSRHDTSLSTINSEGLSVEKGSLSSPALNNFDKDENRSAKSLNMSMRTPYSKSQLTAEERQSQIHSLLLDGNPRLLPEISKFFPSLTDKTVQRDLQSLIDSGKVRKLGERRWSKYVAS